MQKLQVCNRNAKILCRRCGRPLGEVAKHCYATSKNKSGTTGTYCAECGEAVSDSRKHSNRGKQLELP